MNNNNYYTKDNSTHPEHPVRNVFFAIFCFFFSLSFNYLWVCDIIDFEYSEWAIPIAIVVLVASVIGCFFSWNRIRSVKF